MQAGITGLGESFQAPSTPLLDAGVGLRNSLTLVLDDASILRVKADDKTNPTMDVKLEIRPGPMPRLPVTMDGDDGETPEMHLSACLSFLARVTIGSSCEAGMHAEESDINQAFNCFLAGTRGGNQSEASLCACPCRLPLCKTPT
jgi:hypothetical protein